MMTKPIVVKLCLFAGASFAAAVPGFAQSEILVKVPFDFTVGATAMPAGDYAVREDASGVLFITAQGVRKTIGVLTSADNPNSTNETALRFDKVNGKYTLSTVSMFAEPSRRIVPVSAKK